MSASTYEPSIIAPAGVTHSTAAVADAEPAQEGRWLRLLRWLGHRQHLREMDRRLPRDVGLSRKDVRRGLPFRTRSARTTGLTRLGTLNARSCRLKLYAAAIHDAGLRPEDLAAVQRAFRAVLVEPGSELVAGFAVLAVSTDADQPAGSLVLTTCRWERAALHRGALLLPVADEPVRRLRGYGSSLPELFLVAREGRAWQRHAMRPSPSSLAAYLAEDCAR